MDTICRYIPYPCIFIEAKNLICSTMVNETHRPIMAALVSFRKYLLQPMGEMYKSIKVSTASSITFEIMTLDGE